MTARVCEITRRGRPRAEPSTNWDSEEPSLCEAFFARPSDIPMSLARRSRQLAGPAWGTEELLGRRPGLARLPAGGCVCRGKGKRRLDPANVFGAASRGRRDHESFRRERLIRDLVDRLKQRVVTKKNVKILHPSGVRALDSGGNKCVRLLVTRQCAEPRAMFRPEARPTTSPSSATSR